MTGEERRKKNQGDEDGDVTTVTGLQGRGGASSTDDVIVMAAPQL